MNASLHAPCTCSLTVDSLNARQVADLEAFNGKLTDECLMRKQQAEYLHGRMETCQQEISILEVQHSVLASCLLSCVNTSFLQE